MESMKDGEQPGIVVTPGYSIDDFLVVAGYVMDPETQSKIDEDPVYQEMNEIHENDPERFLTIVRAASESKDEHVRAFAAWYIKEWLSVATGDWGLIKSRLVEHFSVQVQGIARKELEAVLHGDAKLRFDVAEAAEKIRGINLLKSNVATDSA